MVSSSNKPSKTDSIYNRPPSCLRHRDCCTYLGNRVGNAQDDQGGTLSRQLKARPTFWELLPGCGNIKTPPGLLSGNHELLPGVNDSAVAAGSLAAAALCVGSNQPAAQEHQGDKPDADQQGEPDQPDTQPFVVAAGIPERAGVVKWANRLSHGLTSQCSSYQPPSLRRSLQ